MKSLMICSPHPVLLGRGDGPITRPEESY